MHVLLLTLQAGEWIRWAVANWIGIFSMLAMLAFILLLVVMALAPDPRDDDRDPQHATGRVQERGKASTAEHS